MSAKAGKRPMRPLSTREKLDAIHRVHDGESKASVARDIGVPESTLRGWCKNEDKIALLSRQSSPDTDESAEPLEKKKKLDESHAVQPFNLSLKSSPLPSTSNPGSFSPNSEKRYAQTIDYSVKNNNNNDAKAPTTAAQIPLDLKTSKSNHSHNNNVNKEVNNIAPKPIQSNMINQSEREKNRAELARLSVELGLNRPEMFMSGVSSSSAVANLNDLSSNIGLLAAQWNHLLMQQQQQAQAHTKKAVSPVANNNGTSSTTSPMSTGNLVNGNSLLTTVVNHHHHQQHQENGLEMPMSDKISTDESVRYWLNTTTNTSPSNLSPGALASNGYPISLSTPMTNGSSNPSPMSGMTPEQSAWVLKWYKTMLVSQYANAQYPIPSVQVPAPQPEKPILYQQLTKDVKEVAQNAENLSCTASLPEDRPGAKNITNTKARAVLDTLLLNNNNNVSASGKDKDGESVSHAEAVSHGEKFLKWLESCSEPSVTAMQIMQFRSLLTNVKASAERKNGDVQLKAKMKRK